MEAATDRRAEQHGVRERRSVKIRGEVQGVFFRQTVRRIAARYDVHGSVRNVDCNVVEIDAEGETRELTRFIDDVLAHPPSGAHIERVESVMISPRGIQGFSIIPSKHGDSED